MNKRMTSLVAIGLAIFMSFGLMQSAALAEETIYSPTFNILKDQGVKLITADGTEAPTADPNVTADPNATAAPEVSAAPQVHREVVVTCEIDDASASGQEFVLQGMLIGFDDVSVKLQWQYDNGKDEDGDGALDGWKDAPGDSQGLQYSIAVSEDILNAKWRLCVAVEDAVQPVEEPQPTDVPENAVVG